MPSVAEAATAKTQLGADLAAGVTTVSLDQKVTFTLYVKLVLPLDGYVFWVKGDQVSPGAVLSAAQLDGNADIPAQTLTVQGSLHYATNQEQLETETPAVNKVVFTALREVEDFNKVSSSFLYIADLVDGVRYAFNGRGPFYEQADLHHYYGTAVYPAMASQLVDSLDGFDSASIIVSNSLPIWLALYAYRPPYDDGIPQGRIRLYPSFAVPDNIEPIYGVVHIDPDSTHALQAAPYLSTDQSHWQLVAETVRVTLYGTRNYNVMDFLDFVLQYSLDYDVLGIMNMPAPRDDKRTQSELSVLAMKKTITFEVNYNQIAARDLARQLILHCIPTIIFPDEA